MHWQNILKKNQQDETWKQGYEDKLMASIVKRGTERPDFGAIKFDNATKMATVNSQIKTTYTILISVMKSTLSKAMSGQDMGRDFDAQRYITDTDAYISDAQTQSSFPIEKLQEQIGPSM